MTVYTSIEFPRLVLVWTCSVVKNTGMDTKYTVGQRVRVASMRGPVWLVVVENIGKIITVCTDSEYEAAEMEGREPVVMGCRQEDVIETA